MYFRHITLPGEYTVAGAQALYERKNELEKIRIPGPIREPILVYVSIPSHLILIKKAFLENKLKHSQKFKLTKYVSLYLHSVNKSCSRQL